MAKKAKEAKRIFVLEDDTDYQHLLQGYLCDNYALEFSITLEGAIKSFTGEADLVLVDICLSDKDPDNKDGLDFIVYLNQEQFDVPIIVLSGYEQTDMPEVIRDSFRSGAIDYIRKSRLTPTFFRKLIADTIDKSSLKRQVRHWKSRFRRVENWDIVGECQQIKKIKEEIIQVARDGHASVLIMGETGTGKELVASAIHQKGWRKEWPFVSVNVSALPRELMNRELFGHERSAFTGADRAKAGYIEEANGGVLFVDEIGEIPNEGQKLLLRVLEERAVYRIGDTRPRKVDFQLVSATNSEIKKAVADGGFRADLYYRVGPYQIQMPLLRERGNDIIILANFFLDQFRKQGRTHCLGLSSETEQALLSYDWPGNVRELRNVIEGAVIKSSQTQGELIQTKYLPQELFDHTEDMAKNTIREKEYAFPIDIKKEIARQELKCMQAALEKANGKKTEFWKFLKGHTNRFTPGRRISKIWEQYPDLFNEVPYLAIVYKLGGAAEENLR